jgi:hypothetical protein
MLQFEVQLFSFPLGVILTVAAFQAEGRISRADRPRVRAFPWEIPHPAEVRRLSG